MGFNTTVFILNDSLSSIERDPQRFVDDIIHNLNSGTDHAVGQTTVMPTQHADVPRLYFTQGNAITELSRWASQTEELYRGSDHGRKYVQGLIDEARQMLDSLEADMRTTR